MRKSTLLWLFLAVFCGAVLFNTSQKVTDGKQRLARLQGDVRSEEESIRVLQAEWSYLNQPERLEKLARQYLDLIPMNGRQFAKLRDIEEAPAPGEEAEREESAKKLIEDAPRPAVQPAPPPPKKAAEPKTAAKPAEIKTAAKPAAPKTTVPAPKITAKPQPSPAAVRAAAPKPAAPKPAAQTATAPKRSFDDMLRGLDLE